MARKSERLLLVAILLLAAALRLWHLDFGLPALNDPDEPVFIMTTLDMLREGRLNPGWFGHPATLLFYLLALVIVAVAGLGELLGRWSGSDAFVAAVFADPGILVLPMRGLSVAFGVVSVWLTWRLGRRVAGPRTGLAAALLLACNTVHVELSQLIRTDMLATLLMCWSMLHALSATEDSRRRHPVWAGIAAGLACAAKWPAVLVLVAPLAAGLWRARCDTRALRLLPVAPVVALGTLLLVSPYLLLDYPAVLRDLTAEARPVHLGATGYGFLGNLGWYIRHPLAQSFGWPGLALIATGAFGIRRRPAAAIVLLPTAAAILIALAAQALVWERWIVPVLPIAAILAAIGLTKVADVFPSAWRTWCGGILLLALATWMASVTIERLARHAEDPRQAATAWVRAHVPPGRTILVEHAAFDLLPYRGRLLFPLGSAGCVDVRTALNKRPSYRRVNGLRQGSAIVDLGHVDVAQLATCDADVAILSNYARYAQEPGRFARPLAVYHRLLRHHRCVATFTSGPRQSDRGAQVCIRSVPRPRPAAARVTPAGPTPAIRR
ncbi:ArnT family glycosyltransferase [Sphingomonas desiccabilis]|nr:glycosyltransferase family 39 protein [Sphingomonas desiccabilis]MBB3912417.1 4-amino-4-deoxy-L-arabinose transferase-like glycosyltransferase [Sphingomonas desiccabilis]